MVFKGIWLTVFRQRIAMLMTCAISIYKQMLYCSFLWYINWIKNCLLLIRPFRFCSSKKLWLFAKVILFIKLLVIILLLLWFQWMASASCERNLIDFYADSTIPDCGKLLCFLHSNCVIAVMFVSHAKGWCSLSRYILFGIWTTSFSWFVYDMSMSVLI